MPLSKELETFGKIADHIFGVYQHPDLNGKDIVDEVRDAIEYRKIDYRPDYASTKRTYTRKRDNFIFDQIPDGEPEDEVRRERAIRILDHWNEQANKPHHLLYKNAPYVPAGLSTVHTGISLLTYDWSSIRVDLLLKLLPDAPIFALSAIAFFAANKFISEKQRNNAAQAASMLTINDSYNYAPTLPLGDVMSKSNPVLNESNPTPFDWQKDNPQLSPPDDTTVDIKEDK